MIVCAWTISGAVAYGWLTHADHYGRIFTFYGTAVLLSAALLTAGTVLYLLRRDLLPAVFGGAALCVMLCVMLAAVHTAEVNGWSGQTASSFGRQAASVWRNGLLAGMLPAVLLTALSLTRFFSYDAAVRRRNRKAAKEERENAPAPSILGDKN